MGPMGRGLGHKKKWLVVSNNGKILTYRLSKALDILQHRKL
jgi:hypothetical protein